MGTADEIDALLAWARGEAGPVRGVIHSAGTLSDRTLRKIGREDFETVFRAKVAGTVVLERATRRPDRDFFVAYSSIASVFGAAGQANHSAANAFMDTYCANLCTYGARATSIAWGPWSETGAAARDEVLQRTERAGLGAFSNAEGLARFQRAFDRPRPLLVGVKIEDAAAVAVGGREKFMSVLTSERPVARGRATDSAPVGPAGREKLADRLAAAPTGAHRTLVTTHLRHRVCSVLGLPPDFVVEARRPLGELGLDSLLAVELRNALGDDIGKRLPASLLFDHPTLDALTDYLLEQMTEGGATAAVRATGGSTVESVESLSDDEVDRLLAEKLRSHE